MCKIDFEHYGEGTIYAKDCNCSACKKFKELIHPAPNYINLIISNGWCDPRRYYLESEEDFIKRVPDGILHWPEDHRD